MTAPLAPVAPCVAGSRLVWRKSMEHHEHGQEPMNDYLDFKGLHELLCARLGEWAPSENTLRTWAKTRVQDANPLLKNHMPRARKMLGERKALYLRRECENFAEAILRDAETSTWAA